jgi:hypothetical protein
MRTQYDTINYYSRQGVALMNAIENKTKKMFHETHSELEESWYNALDTKNMGNIVYFHNQLCKEYDRLDGELEE